MNRTHFVIVAFILPLLSASAVESAASSGVDKLVSSAAPFRSASIGRDFTTWEQLLLRTNRAGEVSAQTNRYTELETSGRYLSKGRWQTSREEIKIAERGAVADTSPHKVAFSGDINAPVSIQVTTPDNTVLKLRPLGLAYYDFHSGDQVLFGELTNSLGRLSATNQALYPDAFAGCNADIRYTYKKGGIEQDVILRERPPLPEEFGLNPETTWLWVLTEVIDPPRNVEPVRSIRRGWKKSTVDKLIRIGDMVIGPGTAFGLGLGEERNTGVPVLKHWEVLEGRTFLIEEVPFRQIESSLKGLQANAANSPGKNVSGRRIASKTLSLPPIPTASADSKEFVRLAQNDVKQTGLVVDFNLVSGTGLVLQRDETYHVTGTVNLTNVIIEGGTVVKYDRGASISLLGDATYKTGPYQPAIFTAVDDDSVGSVISGSTGNPTGRYASPALALGLGGNLTAVNIRYASDAVYCAYNFYTVSHSQFVACDVGLHSETANFVAANILMSQVRTNFYGHTFYGDVLHLTADQSDFLVYDWDFHMDVGCFGRPESCLFITNSITTAVINYGEPEAIITDHVVNLSSGTGVYQSVGGAGYYLAPDSPYRNAGTTAIYSNNLYEISQKTTYPPLVYSNVLINADTTFAPQAQRDFDMPDLGYHYDPLDYVCKWVRITNSVLEIKPGTAIGAFGSYGIAAFGGGTLVSEGRAERLNHFARFNLVQECSNTNWSGAGSLLQGSWLGGATSAYRLRFTDFAIPAKDGNHYGSSVDNVLFFATDCQFHGGRFNADGYTCALTNNLFERVAFRISDGYSDPYPWVRNCLFYKGSIMLDNLDETPWLFRDNLFDGPAVSPSVADGDYNAYTVGTTNLSTAGSHDIVTNIVYRVGPLGNYYQATNSPLIGRGSITANLVGLYHYTTQTNQVKETNSIVDIGFHYVAVNGYNLPVDSDSDSVPDYLEDANGNGAVDSGETDWLSASDLGLSVIITRPKNNSVIP